MIKISGIATVLLLFVFIVISSCGAHPAIESCDDLISEQINKTRYSIHNRGEPIMSVSKNAAWVFITQVIFYPSGREEEVVAGCVFVPPPDLDKAASLNKSPFDVFEMESYQVTTPNGTKKYTLTPSGRPHTTGGSNGKYYIVGWEGDRYILDYSPLPEAKLKEAQDKIKNESR